MELDWLKKYKKCPTCGSDKIKTTKSTVKESFVDKMKRRITPISRSSCSECNTLWQTYKKVS